MSRSPPADEPSPRLARVCAWLCLLLAIALPVAVAWLWTTSAHPPLSPLPSAPDARLRPVGALIALTPTLLLSWALLLARRCLDKFAAGHFFDWQVIRDMRGFAKWGFWAAFAGVLAPTAIGLALTFDAPPGQRMLVISIGSEQTLGMLVSGVFWVMAGALARAAGIADKNRQFV